MRSVIPAPLETWLDSINGLEVVLAALGVLGLLWGAWAWAKKVWPDIVLFVKTIQALAGLPDFITRTDRDLAAVKHEVLPNGGGSMRDSVDRIDAKVNSVDSKVDSVDLRVQKAEAKLDNDHERIDRLTVALENKEPLL